MTDYSKYKDRRPEDTIYGIQGILNKMGLFPVLDWVEQSYKGARSCRVSLYPTEMGTNGKGTDELYATASGYAELMERMNNNILTLRDKSDDFTAETGFREYPDEKDLTPAEIVADPDPFTARTLPLLGLKNPFSQIGFLNTVASMYGKDCRTLPAVPFADYTENRIVYIPLQLVHQITGSNGMAGGNTLEEAIVQGLSELFERRVHREIILGNAVPPEIPDGELKQYSFYPLIEQVRNEGKYRVSMLDCSLGKDYPVAGACVINLETGTFGLCLGAHPSFAVAVDRTLTEALQGKNMEEFSASCYASTEAQARGYHNAANVAKTGEGIYPANVFTRDPDWEYRPWTRWEGKNNREFLQEMLKLLQEEGYRPLIRDTSFLGFPSCYIVIPGFSELFHTDETNRRHITTMAAVQQIWNHFPELTEEEEDKLLRLIRFRQGSILEDQIDLISLRPLSAVTYAPERIVAWLSLKRGDYTRAMACFSKVRGREPDGKERLRYAALYTYCWGRADGMTHKQAQALIRKLYREDAAEAACRDTDDVPGTIRREFPRLNCFDCEHCAAAGKACSYPDARKILVKIKKAMKAENASQEKLLELLNALCAE